MERLTGRKEGGHAYIVGCPAFELPEIINLLIQNVVDRLAAERQPPRRAARRQQQAIVGVDRAGVVGRLPPLRVEGHDAGTGNNRRTRQRDRRILGHPGDDCAEEQGSNGHEHRPAQPVHPPTMSAASVTKRPARLRRLRLP